MSNDFGIDNERFISFLPLSHSYERMAGLYFPLLIGGEIYFCSSLDKLMNEVKKLNLQYFLEFLDYLKTFLKNQKSDKQSRFLNV